jgi:hypothetical protein
MAHVPALLAWLAAVGTLSIAHCVRRCWAKARCCSCWPRGFHQRGRRTEQHPDGGAVRRRLEPARATAAALAGGLLGLLIYKPQLGLLIPVALLAGLHWRASDGVAAPWVRAMSPIGTFRTWRYA